MYKSEVQLIHFVEKANKSGNLVALESNLSIPFEIKRLYYIYNTDSALKRGFHAHKNLKQILIAISGAVKINCQFKDQFEEYILNTPTNGLLIDSMVWHTLEFLEDESVLLVIADNYYDENDYVRDYDLFKQLNAKIHHL